MTSTINHTVRASLDLTLVEYAILERLVLIKAAQRVTPCYKVLGESLGVSAGLVSKSIDRLVADDLLSAVKEGNKVVYVASENGAAVIAGEFDVSKPVGVRAKAKEIWEEVWPYLTELTGRTYHHDNQYNVGLIEELLKVTPTLTVTHFKLVAWHKHKEWGNDDEMKKYVRPSTLFGKKHFLRYLSNAKDVIATEKAKT